MQRLGRAWTLVQRLGRAWTLVLEQAWALVQRLDRGPAPVAAPARVLLVPRQVMDSPRLPVALAPQRILGSHLTVSVEGRVS